MQMYFGWLGVSFTLLGGAILGIIAFVAIVMFLVYRSMTRIRTVADVDSREDSGTDESGGSDTL